MRVLILLAFAVGVAGCNATPSARHEIATLRGEIVDLENQYYALKSMYRDATGRDPDFSSYSSSGGDWFTEGQIDTCIDCGQPHDPRIEYDHPLVIESGSPSNSEIENVPNSRPNSAAPLNEPGTLVDPEQTQPRESQNGSGRSSGFMRPPSNRVNPDFRNRQANRGSPDKGIDAANSFDGFEIDANSTAGYDSDGSRGDDGVHVVLQTNQASGTLAGSISELTFSVIDPEQPQDRQRLGLWKFAAEEVVELQQRDSSAGELRVRLPWQKGRPENDSLLLFVRMRTEGGQSIERSASFKVSTAGVAGSRPNSDSESERTSDPQISSPDQSTGANQPIWRPVR